MLHVKKKVAIQKSYLFLLPTSPYVCISLYNRIAEASTNYENLYGDQLPFTAVKFLKPYSMSRAQRRQQFLLTNFKHMYKSTNQRSKLDNYL